MKKNVDFSVQKILDLCRIPSPSGYTKECEKYLIEELHSLGYKPYQTRKNTVVAELGGSEKPITFASHIDTLGAMVRAIKSDGKLRYTKIGGYPENYIESENCLIHSRENGKKYTGTVRLVNPSVHVNGEVNDIKRNDSNTEIIIDEKVFKEEDVKKLGISVGDFISFDSRTVFTESGFIKSRHLDDKASAGVLLGLAKLIKEESLTLKRKVFIVFTNYEEVGHGASAGIPKETEEMISVDMGALGDDLTCDEYKVSICAKDSFGPYDYDVTSKLIKTAKDNKLAFAVDIYPRYGSDVGSTLSAGYDIKHGLIGPGVYASHGYERTHRDAIKNTLLLLKHYLYN